MTKVVGFSFNPFPENTYVVYDETKECIIFDPGCYDAKEEKELADFISRNDLRPVRLINTHCHLDHIFGNKFVAEKYQLGLEFHKDEIPIFAYSTQAAQIYGLQLTPSPEPSRFLEEGEIVEFGKTKLEILLTPGHSPGSLCFYCKEAKFVIAGDVLFRQSIGKTQGLPMTDHNVLIKSIKEKLLPLGDDVAIYPGHGPATLIGFEKKNNPHL